MTTASPPPFTAVLVVEDEPHTREALMAVVTDAFGPLPIAAADGLAAGRAALASLLPSLPATADPGRPALLALVDIGLPDGCGLDLLPDLMRLPAGALPVVATIFDDDDHLFGALAAGAQGYLLKDHDRAAMLRTLRRIHDGEPPLSPAMARRLVRHFHRPPPAPDPRPSDLTPRETEVLRLLGRGLRTPEVAEMLGVSAHTVASHVKAIYAKLHISSRAEAALEARSRGLA